MKCPSGKNWGQNSYCCDACGRTYVLNTNDEILPVCECGNDSFDTTLVFERSVEGFGEKGVEIIHILETSIFLCEVLKITSFYNVIATQLRILFINGDTRVCDSILDKKRQYHQHSGKYFESIGKTSSIKSIMPSELFDESKVQVSLKQWLQQPIAWDTMWQEPITIKEYIYTWSNKNGGAHVDPRLNDREMFIIGALGPDLLAEISRYIIKSAGYDLTRDLFDDFIKPYQIFQSGNSY